MAAGQSGVGIKGGELPSQIKTAIINLGNPTFVWRESLVNEICPDLISYRAGRRRNESNIVARNLRRKITICMSDPCVCGYVYDGGNTHNPRFKRVE